MALLTPPKYIAAMCQHERETPNGMAQALLTCCCGKQVLADLFLADDDTTFDVPEGWLVYLPAVVRCPEHREIM